MRDDLYTPFERCTTDLNCVVTWNRWGKGRAGDVQVHADTSPSEDVDGDDYLALIEYIRPVKRAWPQSQQRHLSYLQRSKDDG